MLCTITTDASHCETTQKSAYAFIIKSEKGTIKKADKFKELPVDAGIAEFQAIINSVHYLLNSTDWPVTKIIINTDSKSVVTTWQNLGHRLKKYNVHLWMLKDIVGDLTVEMKHCKAHVKNGKGVHELNNMCDKLANKARKNNFKL